MSSFTNIVGRFQILVIIVVDNKQLIQQSAMRCRNFSNGHKPITMLQYIPRKLIKFGFLGKWLGYYRWDHKNKLPHTLMLMEHIENALNLKYKIGTIVYISSGDVRLHTL